MLTDIEDAVVEVLEVFGSKGGAHVLDFAFLEEQRDPVDVLDEGLQGLVDFASARGVFGYEEVVV